MNNTTENFKKVLYGDLDNWPTRELPLSTRMLDQVQQDSIVVLKTRDIIGWALEVAKLEQQIADLQRTPSVPPTPVPAPPPFISPFLGQGATTDPYRYPNATFPAYPNLCGHVAPTIN